jgi:RNA polymerase sigma-70 factor, ECF subfamily
VKWPSDSVAQATEPRLEAPAESAGGGSSFEELAIPLFGPLYNFAHWLTQNREEAEDLVQETYAKALKNFASFTPGTNFRAWIYRILRNTFLTSRTGMRAAATVPIADENEESVLPSPAADPESLLLARANQEMIRGALEQLPLRFREIILLCDLEEMSYREIAATLGLPLGTVMSRLSRARAAMRELLRRESRRASNGL